MTLECASDRLSDVAADLPVCPPSRFDAEFAALAGRHCGAPAAPQCRVYFRLLYAHADTLPGPDGLLLRQRVRLVVATSGDAADLLRRLRQMWVSLAGHDADGPGD